MIGEIMESKMVLALYDFASKQDYIYKTSKIKEISGASLLLNGMYKELIGLYNIKYNNKFHYEISESFDIEKFPSLERDAEVLYDGGGNLMVIYKGIDEYEKANKLFSEHILKNYPGLTMIASHVKATEIFDKKGENGELIGDRDRLYAENAKRKNLSPAYDMPTVTPFTQIDPMTFLPVTYKRNKDDPNSVYPAIEVSLSSDRFSKAKKHVDENKDKNADDKFNDEEGMLAIIYIDGNQMGKKLKACQDENYDKGVENLRNFSENVKKAYVDEPLAAIEKKFGKSAFREVIAGGDEINIICKAEDALKIMKTYFERLNEKSINGSKCTSCAGIAVFHAKSPFAFAYGIAEAACESAKAESRSNDDNYFDFHYCHSGITADFETIRNLEQSHATERPYAVSCLTKGDKFDKFKNFLNNAGRSNVKDLGAAAQISKEQYKLEVSRVNAYLDKNMDKLVGSEEEMKIVYDMSELYDLWFSKDDKKDGGEKDA